MPFCFAITLFVSATLLFLVQPMIAKMILPLLGGAPAVWNTCMVFFQAVILADFASAHFIRRHLDVRRQVLVHGAVVLLPLLVLPIRVETWVPSADTDPILWLLGLLFLCVGLPFFAVATSAPLLQDWFSKSRHHTAEDPYYLYAASNAGSLPALLASPLLLEPNLRLAHQSWIWMAGYGLFILLVAGCGLLVWKGAVSEPNDPGPISSGVVSAPGGRA